VPFRDTAVEGFENGAAARAFASLPERWQAVLWHTEVEDQKPAEVAVLLGMSANSVSALAYRAREGLRQAFLTMHLQELEDDACAWTHQNLGAYVRNGISRRDAAKVEQHLTECRRCTALYLELTEVNSNLSGLLAPLLLGGAAAAYVGSAAGVAALKGALVMLLDRTKDFVVTHAPATATAGVAAAVAVGGGVFMAIDGDDPARPEASPPGAAAGERPGADRAAEKRRHDKARRSAQTISRIAALTPPTPDGPSTAPAPEAPPGPGPTSEPTGDPAPPSPEPPPAPTPPPPPPPPEPDLRVSARVTSEHDTVHRVVAVVSGLAPQETATLTVAARGLTVVLTSEGACDSPHPRSCRVASSPTTLEFSAVTTPGSAGALVFTVASDDGADDADPSNNRVTVHLGS
jgi:hypothetical protein